MKLNWVLNLYKVFHNIAIYALIDSTIALFICYMWGGLDHVSAAMLLVLPVFPSFLSSDASGTLLLSHKSRLWWDSNEKRQGQHYWLTACSVLVGSKWMTRVIGPLDPSWHPPKGWYGCYLSCHFSKWGYTN